MLCGDMFSDGAQEGDPLKSCFTVGKNIHLISQVKVQTEVSLMRGGCRWEKNTLCWWKEHEDIFQPCQTLSSNSLKKVTNTHFPHPGDKVTAGSYQFMKSYD